MPATVNLFRGSAWLTEDGIRALITSLGDLRNVIRAADPAVKAAIYEQLGLKVTDLPGQTKSGAFGRMRGGTTTRSPPG